MPTSILWNYRSTGSARFTETGKKRKLPKRDGSATKARHGREKHPGNMNNSHNNKLLCRNKKIALFKRDMFLPQGENERKISAKNTLKNFLIVIISICYEVSKNFALSRDEMFPPQVGNKREIAGK
jgi:hypothetical protein